jgi:xanthosine utilization system XapX-like protein
MISSESLWQRWKPWLLSAVAGAALGIVYRLLFSDKWSGSGALSLLMTIAFLTIVPLCVGYIAVDNYLRNAQIKSVRWFNWLFLPWTSILIAIAVALMFHWEGAICVIFAAPLMLVFSIVGGLVARILWGKIKHQSPGTLSAVAFPLVFILLEAQVPFSLQVRSVETDVLIHAPASVVWDNIKSVRQIDPSELPQSWVTRIGFPKPVAATLSHEGVGGVREASFTGGLVFTETVNRWVPDSDLRFSIHANTNSIPNSTLDEHVTVGGAFFDVLDGEYRIEPQSDGVLLRLTSHERLSTHFNPYAGVWTDAVMRSIQNQILEVIRKRCESGVAQAATKDPRGADRD